MRSVSASAPRLRHLPALDGLRALALLGVLFFHANGALPGGYLGVDLFFVLSGYLITALLLAEHRDTGRIALGDFWRRRARRLFPALLSMMPAIALYVLLFAKPSELASLRADAVSTLFYVANWRSIFSQKSYWELFAAPSPLEHTWSLSIEEQFYVVWPLVVAWLLKRRAARAVLVVSLVLTALSMVAMAALFDPANSSRAYLGTDTRAASILAGAALAAVLPTTTRFAARTIRALDGIGIVAIIGLAIAWCGLDGQSAFLYRGGFWLTELCVLALVVCAVAGRESLVARALSVKPLTLLGTISYGVYLWHWPVNVVLTADRMHVSGAPLHAVRFAITFAIAIVSYRYLEKPIRARGVPFGRPIFVVPAAVALSLLLVERATYARRLTAPPTPLVQTGGLARDAVGMGATAAGDGGVLETPPEITYRVLLLGDSTANSLGWGLRGMREPGVAVDLLGQDGCTMLGDMCGGEAWPQNEKELTPNATLIFFGGAFLHGLSADGGFRKSCHPAWDAKFEATLARRVDALAKVSDHVWLVTLPYPLGAWESTQFRTEVDCINASLRSVAKKATGPDGRAGDRVKVLELGEQLCPRGVCTRHVNDEAVRPDGLHFSVDGAADLSKWVLEEVRKTTSVTSN